MTRSPIGQLGASHLLCDVYNIETVQLASRGICTFTTQNSLTPLLSFSLDFHPALFPYKLKSTPEGAQSIMAQSTPPPQYMSVSPDEPQVSEHTLEPDSQSVSLLGPKEPSPSASSSTSPALGNYELGTGHNIIDSWWLEFLALFVCLASFSGLLYLLFAYDGKPISEWTQFPLSLNALVSILSGISRASLAFVISMCLSQAKWNWATRYVEPLIDFERFDAASRGPWGCLRLMRSFLRRP